MAKVQRRQLPDVGMLFLNLTVRREHLVSDSLNEVSFFVSGTFSGASGSVVLCQYSLVLILYFIVPDFGYYTPGTHVTKHLKPKIFIRSIFKKFLDLICLNEHVFLRLL